MLPNYWLLIEFLPSVDPYNTNFLLALMSYGKKSTFRTREMGKEARRRGCRLRVLRQRACAWHHQGRECSGSLLFEQQAVLAQYGTDPFLLLGLISSGTPSITGKHVCGHTTPIETRSCRGWQLLRVLIKFSSYLSSEAQASCGVLVRRREHRPCRTQHRFQDIPRANRLPVHGVLRHACFVMRKRRRDFRRLPNRATI